MFRRFMVLCVLIPVAACMSAVAGAANERDDNIRILITGRRFIGGGGEAARMVRGAKNAVFADEERYEAFWHEWHQVLVAPEAADASAEKRIPAPPVDFDTELAVFLISSGGELPGHRIEFSSVTMQEDVTVLNCRDHAGRIVGMAMQPFRHYVFATVPKTDPETVTFEIERVEPFRDPDAPLPPTAPPRSESAGGDVAEPLEDMPTPPAPEKIDDPGDVLDPVKDPR